MTEPVLAMPDEGRTASSLPAPSPGPESRRASLERFVHGMGCSLSSLAASVDRSFGAPHLVVAAGSVTAGFATARSDLDLFTIVPNDDVTLLPLMGYVLPVRTDVRHLSERSLRETEVAVRDGWPPPSTEGLSRDMPARREALVDALVRLALGVVVEAHPSSDGSHWQAWRASLEAPWLVEHVLAWRWWEAWRFRAVSRWLAPMVAAQRLAEATVFALDAVAAEAGDVYTGIKWLPRKLARLGASGHLDALRSAQGFLAADNLGAHVRAVDDFVGERLDELAGRNPFLGGPARVVLTWASDVEVIDAFQRQFVTRWRLRAVELRPAVVSKEVASGEEPVWQGGIDEDPPAWVVALLQQGMLSALVARGD